MPRDRLRAGTGSLAVAAVLVCSDAGAFGSVVDASLDAQYYTLSGPYGGHVVRRRRYTQHLGLSLYELLPSERSGAPELSFRSRLRLDADFGVEAAELDPAARDRFIPGLEESALDLSYAYFEGRNFVGGALGFRVGRQYLFDSLGLWSFDGGLVELSTPVFVKFGAYGGFEQRSGLPLSTGRFEARGVYRGDRDRLELNAYPGFLEARRLAPAYGLSVQTFGLDFLTANLVYRRVVNRDTVLVSPFLTDSGALLTVSGDRVASEKVGGSVALSSSSLGSASGRMVYDLYTQLVSEYELGASVFVGEPLTISAELSYYLPTFDADSIFNWFAHYGVFGGDLRTDFIASRRLDFGVSTGFRAFSTDADPEQYAAADSGELPAAIDENDPERFIDTLASVTGRYRWSSGSVLLAGSVQGGATGRRLGADWTTEKSFDDGYYHTLVILSLYDWSDALRPERDATSLSYVLGGGLSPRLSHFGTARFGVEWEHAVNRLVGHRFRVLATLSLELER